MADNEFYALMAVLHEVNRREFRNKLSLFSEDLHYFATVASSIVGAENARRIRETPAGVTENSEEFVAKLLEITSLEESDAFREVLETWLIETLKDELKFSCLNCVRLNNCLDLGNLTVGALFQRRVHGEETDALRKEISREVEAALQNTPYAGSDEAHRLCGDFIHQYNASNVGGVFGRYADIALSLQARYGLDYKKFLQDTVSVNMAFFEKCSEKNTSS